MRTPFVVVRAIGSQGWAVAERPVDHPTLLSVERVADELRSTVRSETGRTPIIVVTDPDERDVTAAYEVN